MFRPLNFSHRQGFLHNHIVSRLLYLSALILPSPGARSSGGYIQMSYLIQPHYWSPKMCWIKCRKSYCLGILTNTGQLLTTMRSLPSSLVLFGPVFLTVYVRLAVFGLESTIMKWSLLTVAASAYSSEEIRRRININKHLIVKKCIRHGEFSQKCLPYTDC